MMRIIRAEPTRIQLVKDDYGISIRVIADSGKMAGFTLNRLNIVPDCKEVFLEWAEEQLKK